MKHWLKYPFLFILCYCSFALSIGFTENRLSRNCYKQVNYLAEKIHTGLDRELQSRYPEGFVFSHALLALSIIELSEKDRENFKECHRAYLLQSLDRLCSNAAKSSFPDHLTLRYGAFYSGWTNFVLKKFLKASISQGLSQQEKFADIHNHLSQQIIEAFESDTILETYSDSYWPADNLACIASLDSSAQANILPAWRQHLELSSLTLIPHDLMKKEIRASSQALSLYFLTEIKQDSSVLAMNELFLKAFRKKRLGVHFLYEHMDGSGQMDVDSGPIIWGFGSVATIMNVRAQSCINENSSPTFTYGFLNLLAAPMTGFKSKYYLFKQVPMFDLFMLWVGVSMLDKV